MSDEAQPLSVDGIPPEKLTSWKHEPQLSMLKGDVEAARPTQAAQMLKIKGWLDNLNMEGSAKLKPEKNRSRVQPKLIRKQAEWRYTALSEPFLSTDDLFKVKPISWEDTEAAEQNTLVLNWQFRTKLNAVTLVDQFVRAVVDEGTVAVRVGWERETKMETVKAPTYEYYDVVDQTQMDALRQAVKLQRENPNAFAQLAPDVQESVKFSIEQKAPMQAIKIGEEDVQQEKVLRNEPCVEVININNLIIDPSCEGNPEKAMFMAYSSEMTRGSLMRDPRYRNLDKVNWEGQTILSQPDHASNTPQEFNFKDNSRQKVVVVEYWGYFDVEGLGHMTPIVAAWIGDVLIRMEVNPYPDGKPPFVIVPYLPQKRSAYGEPDGSLLEDNQKIIGAVTRGMIDLMARSANAQRGTAKNMLDVPNRRRFESGQDYEFNPNIHPSNGIVEHKFPEIPQSGMGMIAMNNAEAESLTGTKTFDSGLTGASLGPTAAGTKGVLAAVGQREMGILRRLAKGMALIGGKIIAMNQEFMSEEEVVRLTNDKFITVRRDELQGNFDMKVDISTAEEDNAKAQELSFMLQTMGPHMDLEMSKIVLAEIATLRRMPALAHKFKNYQPQPNPLDEQEKQLKLQELQAKINKANAEAELARASIPAAQAKARELSSKADKTDLDYVEQETGTKHARDMDRASQQAEANQNLVVTKGILDQKNPGSHPDGKVDTSPTEDNLAQAIGFNALTKVGT